MDVARDCVWCINLRGQRIEVKEEVIPELGENLGGRGHFRVGAERAKMSLKYTLIISL